GNAQQSGNGRRVPRSGASRRNSRRGNPSASGRDRRGGTRASRRPVDEGREPGGGGSRRRALHDDAVACPANGARMRAERIGFLYAHRRDREGPESYKNGGGIRRGGNRARQSRAPPVAQIPCATRIVAG